MKLKTVEYLRK